MTNDTNSADSRSDSSTEFWQPESPFLDKPLNDNRKKELSVSKEMESYESPFLSVYQSEGIEDATDPKLNDFLELMAEFHDEEFDDAIQGLVSEASEFLEESFPVEAEEPSFQLMRAENILEEYFAPLERTTERYIDNLLEKIERTDLNHATDSEIDSFLNQFEMETQNLSPAFEYFFKKLRRKVKGFAKKAAKFARKFTPIGLALKGLKKIIKPLLRRVLKMAINKLPVSLRPIATRLAKKFSGETSETEYEYEFNESSSQDVAILQNEFDAQLANLLIADSDVDQEFWIAEYERATQEPISPRLAELEQARNIFIDKITQVQNPEEAFELVENFIPAVLGALKIGIRLIGRKKVVKFLAKLIAKLIGRFVGQKNATLLSQAIVDTGLRLMGFEVTQEEQEKLAGKAIASTVEETVMRIAALPETVFEDETLLESHLHEIFESAAAGNFPTDFIKPELRETSGITGTWMMMPIKRQPKYHYKKFSKVFENVKITPQIARQLRTFNGTPLSEFFKNVLGIPSHKPVVARVHLYEAIPGTWLSKISKYEKNVYGLGSASKRAWSQLHPLTQRAAGILLGQPGLGRTTHARFRAKRNLIRVGQRFYYLEIPGTNVQLVPDQTRQRTPLIRKSSQVNLTLDFIKNQIRVYIFTSEADAQDIATQIRKNYPMHAWVKLIRAVYETDLRRIFTGKDSRRIKIINENTPMEEGLAPAIAGVLTYFGEKILDKLIEWIGRYISEYFQKKAAEFVQCTENPADGATIIVTVNNPPGFNRISNILKGKFNPLDIIIPSGIPSADIQIVPGYRSK